MPKKLSDNQAAGYMGEDEFRLLVAKKFGWLASKIDHDHGLDFVCQVPGDRLGEKTAEMPGNLLAVSVRSTAGDGDAIKIERDDAELLFSTNIPMVFAIIRRGSQDEMGQIAFKFPTRTFIRELDAFLRSGAQSHQLRFSDAVTEGSKIRSDAEEILREPYVSYLTRLKVELRLEGIVNDPKVEIIHTESGSYVRVRSSDIGTAIDVTDRPDVASAIRDISSPFKVLPNLLEYSLGMAGAAYGEYTASSGRSKFAASPSATGARLHHDDEHRRETDGLVPSPSIGNSVSVLVDRIQQELAVWNFAAAATLATQVEVSLEPGTPIRQSIDPGVLVLLARVRINQAETKGSDPVLSIEKAKILLRQAEELFAGDTGRLAETWALRCTIEGLENSPEAALALLEGHVDPYAVRARLALLLNQGMTAEALEVLEGLEPHERWCELAVVCYVLNDKYDKAQEIINWAAGLHDRSRLPQCIVRMADALMVRALANHPRGKQILTRNATLEEREKLDVVTEALQFVLDTIVIAGRPTSELDLSALRIACNANILLQRREKVVEFMGLLSKWSPLPKEVARGVISGFVDATPELLERLRRDHPNELEANILAAAVQSFSLGQHNAAFGEAKALVQLADNNAKKEELFQLLQQIWQNLEGPEALECEAIAGPLVAHHPRLHAIFEAGVLLRKRSAEAACIVLDRESAEDDIYWLQLRANACMQKGQIAEAAEFLFMAAKKTLDATLLHKAGDLALQVEKHDMAVWCYEQLVEIEPGNVGVRGNLAHIFAFVRHDLEKALVQFRSLHSIEPGNRIYTFNLAVCLAWLFQPEESLALYEQLCSQEKPSINAVLGLAQLHHSLGHPEAALASLNRFRTEYWNDQQFLFAYMADAQAAGDETAAHDALMALNDLREKGAVDPKSFRMVDQDEALELLRQSHKQTQDRGAQVHAEMIKGRMPWVWAEQVTNSATYWGWRTRTQEMGWIQDDPANRARFSIYSTNGFHARASDEGRRELAPLQCPPAGTKVVADLASLITLQRLGLLETMAEYFGAVIVPAGYLQTVLDDSRLMVLNQRSLQKGADQITKAVNSGRIGVLDEGAKTQFSIVDEHKESADHCYRLIDLASPVYDAGSLSDAEFGRISRVAARSSTVDETHAPLARLQDVLLDLPTLDMVTQSGLLDAVTAFFRVHILPGAQREIVQRQTAIAWQEETREWHMDLWHRLRHDARFRFVPHAVPEEMRRKNVNLKDHLPFLASFVALETNTPLLADDRVCQALILNGIADPPPTAFGTDVLVVALMADGRLEPAKAAAAIRQLMAWRYRFIVPPPEVLKVLADQYRGKPPGQAMQEVAEYVHDCMRDPGLFGGPEPTQVWESMAMKCYFTWVTTIAEFLIQVWTDGEYVVEAATRLTHWTARELLPSMPRVLDGRIKTSAGALTSRLFLSRILIDTSVHSGNPRLADAMKAIKEALRLSDDEYLEIVTGILHDTGRRAP